jgi:hypothetical protein
MNKKDFEKAAVVGVAAGVGAAGVGIAAWLVIGLMQPVAIALAFMLIGVMDLGNYLSITWPIKLAVGFFFTGLVLTVWRGDREDLRMQLGMVGMTCLGCIGVGMALWLQGGAGEVVRDLAQATHEAESPIRNMRNMVQSLPSLISKGFPWLVLVTALLSAIHGSVTYISGGKRETSNTVSR